jgi:4-hydroxy-3-methylbut-2-en-1-yl diphosphate reductase
MEATIETARLSGYCFGVKRALSLTEAVLEKYRNKKTKVYSIGQIIHNKGVIEKLREQGLTVVESVEEVEPGSIFIGRSHGMSRKLAESLKNKNVKIIDTSCPFVKNAQQKAKLVARKGYYLVIIGDPDIRKSRLLWMQQEQMICSNKGACGPG